MEKELTVITDPAFSFGRSTVFDSALSSSLPLLSKWVFSRVPAGIDAEDVIQQTVMLALRHAGKFRFEASVGTWLCSIATNELCARLRSKSRLVFEDRHTLEHLEIIDKSRSPLAVLEGHETYVRVRLAVARLPEIYRRVVELRDFEGLSTREASRRLSISISCVKSRHLRARRQLLTFLGPPFPKAK